jgi:uncharacterized membrane protein YhaH (DUF805 family)
MGAIVLNAIFSFHGRLGRLAFIGWTLAAIAVVFGVTLLFLLLGSVLAGSFSAAGAGPHILGIAMGLAAVIIGIWTTLALQAKRLRDMGFRPLTWILGATVVMMADQWLLTQFTVLRFFPPLQQYTPLGGFIAAAYMIMLLLWPSAEEPQAIAPQPPESRRPRTDLPAPASPTLLATPSQRQPRTEFGLRSRT